MLFSHISDLHLGLIQYGLEERENDIYNSFKQSIDISIKDHVDFVIFSGDIFHTPNTTGNAMIHLANELRLLKNNNIESFFILGEHDISRIRSTPIPFVYNNLGFSRYIGNGKPIYYKDIMLTGFDKIRKNEMPYYEKKFNDVNLIASRYNGHKILVMHQAINEINKFSGELNSTDLPNNFTYYAMGHLHDKYIKKWNHLHGPISYPGSIELTSSEGIKNTKKGFCEVDASKKEVKVNWIKLDTRPQMSFSVSYDELSTSIHEIVKKINNCYLKPIVELKITGKKIENDVIQKHISKIFKYALLCFWKIMESHEGYGAMIYNDKPVSVDKELLKLAIKSTNEEIAKFAINELLPLLSINNLEEAQILISENYTKFKSNNDTSNRIK